MSTHARGFTLIELLMVIAIIGILSSTILGSMNDARLKAADAAVMQEAIQLRNLMEQERGSTGSYKAIKDGGAGTPGPWIAANGGCRTFTGQYAANAAEICKKLVAAASTGGRCGTTCVYFQTTSPDATDKYSIMAYLPYASKKAAPALRYLCYGSSGNSTTTENGAAYDGSGCQSNP